MREPISPEAAESYADIREKDPRELYLAGTRGRVAPSEPSGENLLHATIALQLSQEITSVGLASLGETGLLQLAKRVVGELDDETVTEWTETLETRQEQEAPETSRAIPYVFTEFGRAEIRQLAEEQVATQFGLDAEDASPLSELLGDADFFRDHRDDDSNSPPDDRYRQRTGEEQKPIRR